METTIAALILLGAIYLRHVKKEFLFSIALALLVFARLEMYFFFVVPYVLMTVFSKTGITKILQMIKDSFRLLIPSSVVLGTFAISNYVRFQHFSPISGVLKSGFPFEINFQPTLFLDQPLRALYTGSLTNFLFFMPIYFLVGFTAFFIYSLYKSKKQAFSSTIFVYSVIGLLLMLNILLFQKWNKVIETWYMTIPLILLGLIISTFVMKNIKCINNVIATFLTSLRINRLSSPVNIRRIKTLVIIGFVMFSMVYSVIHIQEYMTPVSNNDPLTEWIDGVDDNTIFAATDCGRASFFFNKRFVNLDGLVNSYEYQTVLKNGTLYEYLKKIGVSYIIIGIRDGNYPYYLREYDKMYEPMISPAVLYGNYTAYNFTIYSYMYGVYSNPIVLNKSSEVFRGPISGDVVKGRIIVYEI
jgi:hypothetical protein